MRIRRQGSESAQQSDKSVRETGSVDVGDETRDRGRERTIQDKAGE
jgi:hypothetical protein